MSEHRRKPPQPQGGGRAAARRGQPGRPPAAAQHPRGATGSPSVPTAGTSPYGGRAEARRAAQRGGGAAAGRRAGGGGAAPRRRRRRRGGPGAGAGAATAPGQEALHRLPALRTSTAGGAGCRPGSWSPALCVGFFGCLVGAGRHRATPWWACPTMQDRGQAQNNVYYWADGSQMVATGGEVNRQIVDHRRRSPRRCRTR